MRFKAEKELYRHIFPSNSNLMEKKGLQIQTMKENIEKLSSFLYQAKTNYSSIEQNKMHYLFLAKLKTKYLWHRPSEDN